MLKNQSGHQCNETCEFDKNTNDCLKICNFGKNHNCGKEPHYCNEDCNYKGIARNCGQKCKLKYPHIPFVHNCENAHLCQEYCDLRGKAKIEGCKDEECKVDDKLYNLVYDHKGSYDCGYKHIYKDYCSKICNNGCKLPYGDTLEEHDCGQDHLCKKECPFLLKSRNCHKTCYLPYGHKDKSCIWNLRYNFSYL